MIKYTVVVPCYNSEKYIDNLYEILNRRDKKDYEVIFVDDFSKDNTYSLLVNHPLKKDNFIVLRAERNLGPGNARNLAIDRARGQFLLFCDSDDFLDLNIIDSIDDLLIKKPDADFIIFTCLNIGAQKTKNLDYFSKYTTGDKIDINTAVKYANMLPASALRTKIVKDNNIKMLNRFKGEDKCFIVEFLKFTENIYKLNKQGYHYIYNKDSIMRKQTKNRAEKNKEFFSTYNEVEDTLDKYFPEIKEQFFIDYHLLANAKYFAENKSSNKFIKNWFKENNKKFPNWIKHVEYNGNYLYKKLIYKAMYVNNPILIKLIMWIRRKIF